MNQVISRARNIADEVANYAPWTREPILEVCDLAERLEDALEQLKEILECMKKI